MLLHECLKYPNVELVLGLELDQRNVRESLGRFKTQPHFDDPRVQWWFGDAAKSLTLLPRDWFGTFDLVMVDLSETGMSISVNSDLDIFGALALLLKPEGIMVKNEDYFGQMSKYFDYSLSVYMVSGKGGGSEQTELVIGYYESPKHLQRCLLPTNTTTTPTLSFQQRTKTPWCATRIGPWAPTKPISSNPS